MWCPSFLFWIYAVALPHSLSLREFQPLEQWREIELIRPAWTFDAPQQLFLFQAARVPSGCGLRHGHSACEPGKGWKGIFVIPLVAHQVDYQHRFGRCDVHSAVVG